MTSFESEAVRVIDKFNKKNFNIWKFKIQMLLASMDIWDIVDGSKKTPPSNADPRVLKEYQRRTKNTMSIIGLNMTDNQLVHIKSCKGSAEVWKTLCNIYDTKILFNILFIRCKFFTYKMQKCDDLLDHVNKFKAFANQLVCLEISVRDEDIVKTLFKSMSTSYKYLTTALKTMPMKEITIDYYVTARIHEMSKGKEKKLQDEDATTILRQNKGGNSFLH